MGLNYNIPQTQNLHPVAREHRIRIWWTIYVLDRFWGSKSGFPVQIHDEDIHVDLPSISASETYPDQFLDGAYQVAAIELAKIIGDTTGEIYCRKISAETFLHREQSLLTQLKQWVRSLPEHLRLSTERPNSKHTVQMHLQFNFVRASYSLDPFQHQTLTTLVCHPGNSTSPPPCPHFKNQRPNQSVYGFHFTHPDHFERGMYTRSKTLASIMCK